MIQTNNNREIVLKLLFLCVRLAVTFVSTGIDTFMRALKSVIQYVDRFGEEKFGNQVVEHIDQYLSLSGQLKNLWMSDITYWKPNSFGERISAGIHDGKVAVVTGADRDVGQYTSLALAKIGFKVIMGVRNSEKINKALSKFMETHKNYRMTAFELKTSSLESVRQFANKVIESEPKIDLLVNSSERLIGKRLITKEGFERQFVENYLGHFLLTNLLLDNLKKSTDGRVINVSDVLFHIGSIDFNDLSLKRGYNVFLAFARSKLAQVSFNRELAHRLKDTSVTTYAMSPNCLRNWKPLPRHDARNVFNNWFRRMSDPVNGGQTILYLALEDLKNESGYFYSNCQQIEYISNKTDELSEKLWKVSEELVESTLRLDDPE